MFRTKWMNTRDLAPNNNSFSPLRFRIMRRLLFGLEAQFYDKTANVISRCQIDT